MLLSYPLDQQLPVAAAMLEKTLQDIVTHVQIKSNFCISHPNYKPLELPAESVVRFQRLPIDLQHKYLNLQLRSFLYGIYYNASLQSVLAADTNEQRTIPYQDLENNTYLGIDLEFYERLHSSNQGKGYFDRGWMVLQQAEDGSVAVCKDGLTLHIDRNQHLELPEEVEPHQTVSIRLPRNLVQNGFYVSVGNAGLEPLNSAAAPLQTVRIYFNLTPEGAVALMAGLTDRLNQVHLPFHFKVLYNPVDYQRYDSGVLYFERGDYKTVREALQSLYAQNQLHFKPEIPLFTKHLAPGIGLAEEPSSKFGMRESFGQNRCQIIANSLMEAWQQHNETPDHRIAIIRQNFALLGIDLERPYLNAGSDDVYLPLEQ